MLVKPDLPPAWMPVTDSKYTPEVTVPILAAAMVVSESQSIGFCMSGRLPSLSSKFAL